MIYDVFLDIFNWSYNIIISHVSVTVLAVPESICGQFVLERNAILCSRCFISWQVIVKCLLQPRENRKLCTFFNHKAAVYSDLEGSVRVQQTLFAVDEHFLCCGSLGESDVISILPKSKTLCGQVAQTTGPTDINQGKNSGRSESTK